MQERHEYDKKWIGNIYNLNENEKRNNENNDSMIEIVKDLKL